MRLTLKAVNAALAGHGHTTVLVKGDGYFYNESGEAPIGWIVPLTWTR